ncbi:MAG: ATP-binding cassette domain-containing protein [Bacillota bacterium]
MLKIVNITFEYITNTKVLRGLNGEFNKGLNIIFANRGEGKTTLLDLLLFPKKNQTNITLNGEILTKKLAKAEISAVLSDWFLKESASAGGNFQAGKHQNKLSKEFLSEVGFFDIESQKISELTLSKRLEITLIKALKKTPSLLVLDSPFVAIGSEKQLYLTLKKVIKAYQNHTEKPLCVLLLSRPFDLGADDVSLLLCGSIIHKNNYQNIRNKPATTTIATAFSAFPNNIYAKGTQNFYVDGNKVEIGSEFEGVISSVQSDKMTIEFETETLEIPIINTFKIGDKIGIKIPQKAVTKLD